VLWVWDSCKWRILDTICRLFFAADLRAGFAGNSEVQSAKSYDNRGALLLGQYQVQTILRHIDSTMRKLSRWPSAITGCWGR
jgi:hypothetical protein